MATTINWQSMTNRERNAIIAEKVFGRSVNRSMTFGRFLMYREGSQSLTEEIPHYSTLMDAAWLIIEKLETTTTLKYTPGFAPQEPDGQSAHYECKLIELDILGGNDKVARAIANTPAEAICVAALRWRGIQVTHTIEAIPCWEVTFEDGETLICKNKHDAESVLTQRERYLKANLQWAVNIRKLKIEEVRVPEDYFNGPVIG